MRGKVAKRLKKQIYGDKNYREREYTDIVQSSFVWGGMTHSKITKVSDKTRKWYQNAKKIHGLKKRTPKQKKEKENESNTCKDSK